MKYTILSIMLLTSVIAWGQKKTDKPVEADPWVGYDEIAFMDMDLDQNIATPALLPSDQKAIRKYMKKLGSDLASKKYIVDMERNDEVVVVTIPTDDLFLPNDTLLSKRAEQKLKPLLNYFREPAMFKVVYSVHTDDTGSPAYLFDLSQERVNSIYDWLLDFVNEDLVIIPYSMGDIDPIELNTTRKGRAANRRVEFYLIPGPEMILKARKGKL